MWQQPEQDGGGEQSLAICWWLLRCHDGLVQVRDTVLLADVGTVDAAGSGGGSVGKVGSGDAYVYADNAPVMTTDPSGKDANPLLCGLTWASILLGAALGTIVSAVASAGPEAAGADLLLTGTEQSVAAGFGTYVFGLLGGITGFVSGACG